MSRLRFMPPVLALALLVGACRSPPAALSFMPFDAPSGRGASAPDLHVADGRVLLSWIEKDEGAPRLRWAALDRGAWGPAATVAEGDDLVVNWADFPSLVALDDGTLAAHWLRRQAPGAVAYDIDFRVLDPDGSEPHGSRPYHDDSATEHGFVSMQPDGGPRVQLVWLDGRDTLRPGGTMRLMAARWTGTRFDEEQTIDDDVCTCCQTDLVRVGDDLLAVYRDHAAGEVRDISLARRRGGRWEAPRPVHRDGWVIAGCPVNGPAAAADGSAVAVAWFTGADPGPRVLVAFSEDAGETFGEPLRVDGGDPLGRADVVRLPDGTTLVSWLEKVPGAAEIRARRCAADGCDDPVLIGSADPGRISGFPRLAVAGDAVYAVWTDPGYPPRLVMARAAL